MNLIVSKMEYGKEAVEVLNVPVSDVKFVYNIEVFGADVQTGLGVDVVKDDFDTKETIEESHEFIGEEGLWYVITFK